MCTLLCTHFSLAEDGFYWRPNAQKAGGKNFVFSLLFCNLIGGDPLAGVAPFAWSGAVCGMDDDGRRPIAAFTKLAVTVPA